MLEIFANKFQMMYMNYILKKIIVVETYSCLVDKVGYALISLHYDIKVN